MGLRIEFNIINGIGKEVHVHDQWWESGKIAEGWLHNPIPRFHRTRFVVSKRDWSVAGVSGCVVYKIDDVPLVVAFNYPYIGAPELRVEVDDWDGRSVHQRADVCYHKNTRTGGHNGRCWDGIRTLKLDGTDRRYTMDWYAHFHDGGDITAHIHLLDSHLDYSRVNWT
jgi:hypothetical protein